jgi:hypothetical protein
MVKKQARKVVKIRQQQYTFNQAVSLLLLHHHKLKLEKLVLKVML